ncbi:MAG TPA: response regulator transcription factor, partial [Blastocatellia bacterium]
MGDEIRVVIADDHPLIRQALRQVLDREADLKVVGESGDGKAALLQVETLKPHIAVLDVDMPLLDGMGVARAAREKGLPVEIIFLTVHREADLLEEATGLGAKGYVLKDSAAGEVVSAIRTVARGDHYISPAMAGHLVRARQRLTVFQEQQSGLKDLTRAERRVLKLISEYKTTKQIADELC